MGPGEHARQDRPRAIQWPAQINLKRVPPLVGIGSRKRANWAELARVVDQEIYRPDRLLDRGDHALHLLTVGDIAPYGERVLPTGRDLTSDIGDFVV
jgi:hypothetical protein